MTRLSDFIQPKPWHALPLSKGRIEIEVVLRHGDASCNAWVEVDDLGTEGYQVCAIYIDSEDGDFRIFDKYDPAFPMLAAGIDRSALERSIAEHGEED